MIQLCNTELQGESTVRTGKLRHVCFLNQIQAQLTVRHFFLVNLLFFFKSIGSIQTEIGAFSASTNKK